MENFYQQVYSRDNPKGEAHGWIQWKGTDACIDLHCKCGYHGHFDGYFLYHYKCPICGTKYALGENVKLIELTAEEATYVTEKHVGFKSDAPDEMDTGTEAATA